MARSRMRTITFVRHTLTAAGVVGRSVVDRWRFLARHHWILVTSLPLLAFEVATSQPTVVPVVTTATAGALVSADYWRVRKERARYDLIERGGEDIRRELSSRLRSRVIGIDSQLFALTPLAPGSAPLVNECRVEGEKYRLPDPLKAVAPAVIFHRRDRATLVNNEVLGLASDVDEQPVRLHAARYFDHLASNYAYRYRIHPLGESSVDILSGWTFDREGDLIPLGESRLSNVVGVSTIAFTREGKLISVRPTERNVGSPGRFHPSGSGSAELSDVVAGSFGATLVFAMERELCEETGLRRDEIVDTHILGWGRWLNQGGKPEFFGITTTSVAGRELLQRRPRGAEAVFSRQTHVHEVRRDSVGVRRVDSVIDLSLLPRELAGASSAPLAVALYLVASRQS